MPRKTVPLVTGEKYHIFNRGTDKRNVFEDKKDYLRFYRTGFLFNTSEPVRSIQHAESKFATRQPLVRIEAYSLLPNHFHFIVTQLQDGGISEYFKRLLGGYTSYFNEKNSRSGVLFQGTFKRVHIADDAQYNYLFAYVNENHFVHGVQRPDEIVFSSSLYYQKKSPCRLMDRTEFVDAYDFKRNAELACKIKSQRDLLKTSLLED